MLGPGPAPDDPRPPGRGFLPALALGAAAALLNQVPLPLLGGGLGSTRLGGMPVLLAFVLLGPRGGLVAGALSLAGSRLPWGPDLVHALLVVLEAGAASRLFGRHPSLVFAVTVYWCVAGVWLAAAAAGWRPPAALGDAVSPALALLLGGLLNAALADAQLVFVRFPFDRRSPARPNLRQYLLTRITLGVVAPCLVLIIADTHFSGPRTRAVLPLTLLLVTTVLLLHMALSAIAPRISDPLGLIEAAVRDLEAGRSTRALRLKNLVGDPITEVRSLAHGFTSMHDALAYHDPLTDLPNRKLLLDRLGLAVAQAERGTETFAVLFIDLDRFRVIDHSLGRAQSNEVLREVAGRVQKCVRPGDTVARMGNDEFAVLIPRITGLDEAGQTAQRVMDEIKRPLSAGGQDVFLTASVGISLFPRDGQDAETLLKNATAATYVAKEKGQDNYRPYTARISAKDAERLVVEGGLRKALDDGGLLLHYQPVLDLRTGSIQGVEGLVRWNRPDRGIVYPAEFISVAEASGLILAVGAWVLRTAAEQCILWHARGHQVTMSVNVSARQFQQGDLVAQVREVLQDTNLPPGAFEIEVTESAAMQDVDRSIEILTRLRKMGVSVAVDDFGTGYSSLSYLKALPVDKVKLDQSFVRDVTTNADDAAIATAVIAMAKSLKLAVVAEGVETEEQLAFLIRHGCDAMQGFLFSRAVTADELGVQLQEGRRLRLPAIV